MEVDAQIGALSVTNPPTDKSALPEVTRVELARADTEPAITRLRPSTELAAGQRVFDEPALRQLFATLQPLARAWLAHRNQPIEPERRPRMATLDLELRRMSGAWPAGNALQSSEPRWVIKQLRSLEPPAAIPGLAAMALPIPGDILLRTSRLMRRTCQLGASKLELLEAYTGAGLEPELGYAEHPFVALATLYSGQRAQRFTHLDFERVEASGRIVLRADAQARAGSAVLDYGSARCSEKTEAAALKHLLHEIADRARRLGGRASGAPAAHP
jgi:hypothetical protein